MCYADKEEKTRDQIPKDKTDTPDREKEKEILKREAERMNEIRAYELAHPEESARELRELVEQELKQKQARTQQEAEKAEAKRLEAERQPKPTPEEIQAESLVRERAIIQRQVDAKLRIYYSKLQKDYILRAKSKFPEVNRYFIDFDRSMIKQGFKVGYRPFVEALEKGFGGIKWGIMIHEEETTASPAQETLVEQETKKVTPANTQITAGVGADAKNLKSDVLVIQRALLRLGLLSESEFNTESKAVSDTATPSVEQEKIVKTIAAIKKFQEEVLHWKKWDGNISGSDSETLKEMRAEGMDCDKAQKKIAEYPAFKAKREAEKGAAEKKKKAAEEAKQKAEEEADRIKCIQQAPATAENASKFINDFSDVLDLADVLKEYTRLNPALVSLILSESGRTKRDNIVYALMQRLEDAELASVNKDLLEDMKSALEAWLVTNSDYSKEIERLERFTSTTLTPQALLVELKIEGLSDEASQAEILELTELVREQLDIYPSLVKAFKASPYFTADEKVKVFGQVAFEAAKTEFLLGTMAYRGKKWETETNSGKFVDVYTTHSNGKEEKSTAAWCAKFVGYIYSDILGAYPMKKKSEQYRGVWGGSQISNGYEEFWDKDEKQGGKQVGQKKVGQANLWKTLRLQVAAETDTPKKIKLINDFFGAHIMPQTGDIMIVSRKHNNSFSESKHDNFDESHTAMIEKVEISDTGVYIYTIEGNAGDKVTGKKYDLLKTTEEANSLASIVNISRFSSYNFGESTALREKEEIITAAPQEVSPDLLLLPVKQMNELLIQYGQSSDMFMSGETLSDISSELNDKVD
ncbi:hypothetical protein N7E81_07155 [Reichenbachiella carrageenanivorans]|uniref:Uncharacterized protein n=1 Tax=Reichenbachiella carrageenanivorans TaxID=2979869 RepID=A0ABY6D405_9BACT|nr:hypothetical protein [Reichenbachiella carrageenanivorans]UXX80876.1 hypothetical protein N7E81_07155 [Reichenbachiella carrageenanivorans]